MKYKRRSGRGRPQRLSTKLIATAVFAGLVWFLQGTFAETGTGPQSNATLATPAPLQQGQYSLTGRVVRVSDGDTFTLLVNQHQEKVRMASIDAPEMQQSRQRPAQAYAQASRQALADMIAGQELTVHCYEKDHYERNICDVPLRTGSTANRQMVKLGMAWANMQGGGKYMRDPELPRLQEEARRAGHGLWQRPDAMAPWKWRYQCWREQQC